jgi:hypothetical protein
VTNHPSISANASFEPNVSGVQVSSRPAERPVAPDKVLDWPSYSTWRDVVWSLIADVVDADVRATFITTPPKYVVSDDLRWLDKIVWAVKRQRIESKALLAERILERYASIRSVHGTRTADVGGFYRNGLIPLDLNAARKTANETFLGGQFPELNAEKVDAAIRAVDPSLREGRVWFEANEPMLVEQCGHYMLYGSEYVIGIAAHLSGPRDYRQALKRVGTPTIFVCDVPWSLIGHGTLTEFAGCALQCVFEELLEGRDYEPDSWRGAGFCIHQALPPECIVGHYHPSVRDPLV